MAGSWVESGYLHLVVQHGEEEDHGMDGGEDADVSVQVSRESLAVDPGNALQGMIAFVDDPTLISKCPARGFRESSPSLQFLFEIQRLLRFADHLAREEHSGEGRPSRTLSARARFKTFPVGHAERKCRMCVGRAKGLGQGAVSRSMREWLSGKRKPQWSKRTTAGWISTAARVAGTTGASLPG